MRELPILFNTEMVRAILDDRKTCTRRVIKDAVKENQEINKNGKGEFELYDITSRCGMDIRQALQIRKTQMNRGNRPSICRKKLHVSG